MAARTTVCSVSGPFLLVSGPRNLYNFISGKIRKFVRAIFRFGIHFQNILSEPKTKTQNRTSVEFFIAENFIFSQGP